MKLTYTCGKQFLHEDIKETDIDNIDYINVHDEDGYFFDVEIKTFRDADVECEPIVRKAIELITAVNAYPALVAENAELKGRLKAIETIVKANLFDGNELLLCVGDGRGRHYLAKEIMSILSAVEKGGKE